MATIPKSSPSRLAECRAHLLDLRVADREAYTAGDWERLDRIRLGIDDTRAEIASIEAAAKVSA